ncbi:hypothetical protein BGX34_000442 [Mortierella sp. NVP85]|nr:hypothetical protein BGX34_000442 [Mortierella sp. NVP85]
MPEQTDKRRSWWGGILSDKPSHAEPGTRSSQTDLHAAYKSVDVDIKNRHLNTANDTAFTATANGADSESKAGGAGARAGTGAGAGAGASSGADGGAGIHEDTPDLRRVSSKIDLLKKSTTPKRIKAKGGSKFATISTAWSSNRSALPGKGAAGSVSSTTVDHFEKASSTIEELSDIMEFTVSEQYEIVDGVRERDVAYNIRAEGNTKIILITRRISDFLDFDERVRIQFPKCRPQLPLLDDRRKSFLVSTRQFFFPRKNTAEKLEGYLRKVASHEPLKSSVILQDFLAVSQEGDLVYSKEQPQHLVEASFQESKSGSDSADRFSGYPGAAAAPSVEDPTNVAASVQGQIAPKIRGSRVRPPLPQIQEQKKITLEDFQLIKVLGRGCMGKVMLVREHKSKKLFAMKAISKEWVILQREIEHTKSERNILANVAKISHPFLIKLRHSFQNNAQLFMVLDYYPGGDIATQLAKWHRFEPERCLFYAAEIVLGIEELHRQGIVYRDLKPENILLALDGHIVLTDFGLSKQFPAFSGLAEEKTNTFCGTAEYLAPEILLAAEYSYPVDWWSLGTLLYEMLCGITPFWAEHHAQMYQRVLEDELEFPPDMDQDAAEFITGLLERNPDDRLGSRSTEDVKSHAYFASINWDIALQRKLPCPYVPELVSEEDLSNFDDAYLTMTPRFTPGNHTLSNSIQNCFQGYSYTDKMASTLPRSDGKIPSDRSRNPSSGSYIQDFDQEAPVASAAANGHHVGNGRQPLYRSRLQEIDAEDQDTESELEDEEEEEEDMCQYRPMPPSAAISSQIETKAAVTTPALTPPSTFPDDGRMPVERVSIGRMAAADILRGYSGRSSIDTYRHNSTGSSSSSGTIGRRLSRGYV